VSKTKDVRNVVTRTAEWKILNRQDDSNLQGCGKVSGVLDSRIACLRLWMILARANLSMTECPRRWIGRMQKDMKNQSESIGTSLEESIYAPVQMGPEKKKSSDRQRNKANRRQKGTKRWTIEETRRTMEQSFLLTKELFIVGEGDSTVERQ